MPTSPRPRAFTLIELLVVIAIIGIIASISLLVASKVTEGGRTDQTKNILRTLDQTLDTYSHDHDGGKFPSTYTDETTQKNEYAIIDARLDTATVARTTLPEPTTQLYFLASNESTTILSAMNGIEGAFKDATMPSPDDRGRLVQMQPVVSTAFPTTALSKGIQRQNGTDALAPRVRDPWGNDIRYVSPRFHGGYGNFYTQASGGAWSSTTRAPMTVKLKRNGSTSTSDFVFRRSYRTFDPTSPPAGVSNPVGDGDEGLCSGSRPYFYSAGPDHDPGTRDDNVYTDKPSFPAETRTAN